MRCTDTIGKGWEWDEEEVVKAAAAQRNETKGAVVVGIGDKRDFFCGA